MAALFLSACNFNTEVSQDPATAAEQNLDHLLAGDYEAIYADASTIMKNYVSEEVFLAIVEMQEQLNGELVEARLLEESTGRYQEQVTQKYEYEITNAKGEKINYSAEFLNGHLLKHFLEEPDWREEPELAHKLVSPVADLVAAENAQAVYQLLEGKYPEAQVQSLLQQINRNTAGANSRYLYHWTDNDENNQMMVAFVYAYQAKGTLEYRFYIKEDYPFAGLFFNPDSSIQLP